MANIKVNKLKVLNPAGTQLFSDAENFINELSHDEVDAINGGSEIWNEQPALKIAKIPLSAFALPPYI